MTSKIRVLHESGCGRSLTYRPGRPFSCSREIVIRQRSGKQTDIHGVHDRREDNVKNNNNIVDNGEVRMHGHGGVNNNSVSQVSALFYFTNFLDRLLYVDLRKGLEVCGILSYVYVSRFRNVCGQRFGFAKFLKVRDVEKLKKALNNVFFWDLWLFANVTKF